jgi:DNA-binding IclR family transcriptional regulator
MSEIPAPDEVAVPDQVADQPPSVKLVAVILRAANRPLTLADIQEITNLPDRTVRRALQRLREQTELLEMDHHLPDPRANEYWLDV